MSKTFHPTGAFVKAGQEWLASIPAGQARTPKKGDHANLHKRNGKVEKVTLTGLVETRTAANGETTRYFTFANGWAEPEAVAA